ncbi:gliding motility-associated C-terminal domain-containing protein [Hymenobacter sp. BT523]|uniref:T9SS type B sorting domain-containing protein n=1 Tax=Hymenobacter sp. BT523 TaxID=2795725 RepID=UPI0018EA9582|nr:gliding motility-associated C-terminal domain-containing protein [Hymenobacter sp. BT523]MBJ6109863.1 gliding motility-associated C-terminal domain-containing protein [Hymenobacter sp. BT523]
MQAQHEFDAWRFGEYAALQFDAASRQPVVVAGSALSSFETCASAADAAGRLRCYTDGTTVWDRLNQPMPHGQLSGSHTSASQGALLVPDPGSPSRLYLFTVDDVEHSLAGGLRFSIVDMNLHGGLGDVQVPNSHALPLPGPAYLLTEALTAVRHANGTDFWIIVHGFGTADFLVYRLQASGIAAAPRRITVGSVHGTGNVSTFPMPTVSLRASPDGTLLAAGVPGQGVELFRFDAATGTVASARQFPLTLVLPSGLEFSDDNSQLYVVDNTQRHLYQWDLATNATTRLATDVIGGMQRGPDGRIYLTIAPRATALGIIASPNRSGAACGYQPAAVPLGTGASRLGLPNFPNAWARPGLNLTGPAASCNGQWATFQASSALAGATFAWDFGDPASGAANAAQGPQAQHRYTRPGIYTVQVTATTGAGSVSVRQTVEVEAEVSLVFLPLDTVACTGGQVLVRLTGYVPGSSFAWSDGGDAFPEHPVERSGSYTVRATSPGGCVAEATLSVPESTCLAKTGSLPTIITPNGDAANQRFVLRGLYARAWDLHIFNRWGREIYNQQQYDNAWAAQGQPDGVYYYYLLNRTTGQRIKGWLEVRR